MPDRPHVLVATLGGQPQIVTFTLDALLQKGFAISEVIVVHPGTSTSPRLARAVLRLQAEFPGGIYQGSKQAAIHFHSHPLALDGQPIDDIRDDAHADGTLDTIHHLLSDLKRQGCHIHLSVSGGRRMIALLATSVASLNFDRHDHIWHLYTPEPISEQASEGKIMHVSPDAGVTLIQGHFIFLGAHISNPDLPFRRAQQEQQTQMEAQERGRCVEVVKQATAAQLKVLRAFARGLTPQQVAGELKISLATVNSHKTVSLSYCRNVWSIPDSEWLDYRYFADKFGNYFETAHP